jgi:hypothetical protein
MKIKAIAVAAATLAAISIQATQATQAHATSMTLRTNDASVVAAFGEAGQGWWNPDYTAFDNNTNYAAAGNFRDFFTFDLNDAALTGATITGATLRLQAFDTNGGTPIEFFDVTSDPYVVNYNDGFNAAVHADLGSGVSYGAFPIPAAPATTDILEFTLNANAIAALNAAIGNGFFMIGGAAATGTNFYSSGANGNQQLVLEYREGGGTTTVPEPSAIALFGIGLMGLGAAVRRRKNQAA